jgi:hypothetical protein
MREEILRQIAMLENSGLYGQVTCEDANQIIEKLGGTLRVVSGADIAATCYYITLLNLLQTPCKVGAVE